MVPSGLVHERLSRESSDRARGTFEAQDRRLTRRPASACERFSNRSSPTIRATPWPLLGKFSTNVKRVLAAVWSMSITNSET